MPTTHQPPLTDSDFWSLLGLDQRNQTVISTTQGSANATVNPAVVFVNDLLDRIPLPRWAIYTIFVGGALLVLIVCLCICIKCCCRGKKKKKNQQKTKLEEKVNLTDVNRTKTTGLVQPDVTDVNYGSTKVFRGKLLYSLEYSSALCELRVGIKRADGLMVMDLGGSSDPYVKVYILPDKSKTCETKVFRNTLNPVFNEEFIFTLPKSTLLKSTAIMQVFDFNRFAKHGLIGEIRIQLGNIDWNHIIEEWQDLNEPAKFEDENLGEICFSLRYVPSAGKLTVVILEAKDLKSMDVGGSSDPYVKLQLSLDRRKWKKRKTSVKKKTLNPYYNESFVFNVPFDQIQRVNLIISVWDQDAVTRNDPMGKIFLGCDATGNQLRHWADMLSNPRRPVAQWHGLLSVAQVNAVLSLKKKLPLPRKLLEKNAELWRNSR
ncbi:synaptotagmin-2-like [Pholidichthys leucotaenia]